jgi:hypothetical protein
MSFLPSASFLVVSQFAVTAVDIPPSKHVHTTEGYRIRISRRGLTRLKTILQALKARSPLWAISALGPEGTPPCPKNKQSWSVLKSAGGDALATADLEIGATVSSPVGWLCRWTADKNSNERSLIIRLHRLPLIEQRTLDEWGTVSSIGVGFVGGRLLRSDLCSAHLKGEP